MTNLPPFYIGQKVTCIKGNKPQKKINIVTYIEQWPCGCWLMEIDNTTPEYTNQFGKCPHCKKHIPNTRMLYGWHCGSFRAIEEKPQYMTFEKIHELEKEEVLINN